MINVKSEKEIMTMLKGGRILANILHELATKIKKGVSELEIDGLAERLLADRGVKPAFKRVKGYGHAICISTNNVVVHGIPTQYRFKEGDVVGIDCGVYYQGFNTDMAETIQVKNQKSKVKSDEINKFLVTGKMALDEGIKQAKKGNRIGNISKTIQDIVEGSGYSIVRNLVGHGIGKELHEEPEVPGFVNIDIKNTPELREGMTIAIEVIYNMGDKEVGYANNDGWTIKTKDNSLSGVFERTIAITKSGPVVLTPW